MIQRTESVEDAEDTKLIAAIAFFRFFTACFWAAVHALSVLGFSFRVDQSFPSTISTASNSECAVKV